MTVAAANLRAMWPNYQALDLEYLVLARVLMADDEVEGYRSALPGVDSVRVVRLDAPDDEVRRRLLAREPGVSQQFLVGIAPKIAARLAALGQVDLVVPNGPDRSVTDMALDILKGLGWPVPATL
jgi:hypothetical protein